MAKIGDIRTTPEKGTLYAKETSATSSTTTSDSSSSNIQSITGDNLGDGEGVYAGANGTSRVVMDFRSLKAGAGIALAGDAHSIVITSTGTVSNDINALTGVLDVSHGGTGLDSFAEKALLLGNGSGPLQALAPSTVPGRVLSWNGSDYAWVNPSTAPAGVTMVNLTAGSGRVSVSGGPITSTGSITVDVVEAALALNNLGGTLNVTKGGTGANSLAQNAILLGNGTAAVQSIAAPTSANTFLKWDGSAYSWSQQSSSGVTSVQAVGTNGITVSGGPITSTGTLSFSLTAVPGITAGSYSYPTLTVDDRGRVTSIVSNSIPNILGTNLGAGSQLYAGKSGDNLTFRSLVAGQGLTLTNDATTVSLGISSLALSQGGTGASSNDYTANGLLYSDGTRFRSIPAAAAGSSQILSSNGSSFSWVAAPSTSAVAVVNGSPLTVSSSTANQTTTYTLDIVQSSLSLNNLGGTLNVTKGGTGVNTLPVGRLLVGNGTAPLSSLAEPTGAGSYFLRYNGTLGWAQMETSGVQQIVAGQGLTTTENSTAEGGVITSTGSLHLTSTGVMAGTYQVLGATVDAKGRLTGATDVSSTVLSRANHTGTMSVQFLTPGSAAPSSTAYNFNSPIKGTTITGTMLVADDIQVPTLAVVAKSGSYTDLINKPTLFSGSYADLTDVPPTQAGFSGVFADLTQKPTTLAGYGITNAITSIGITPGSNRVAVTNSPLTANGSITVDVTEANINLANTSGNIAATRVTGLSSVATTGAYSSLTGRPTLFSGAYADLTGKPVLFSGSYNDLTDVPASQDLSNYATKQYVQDTLEAVNGFDGDYNHLTNLPVLFSGAYADLTGKPVLATVATTGSYNDLTNKPTIPAAYTDSQARAAISVTGDLTYNSTTGVIGHTAYSLPIATASVLGGIKVGSGLAINATTGVLSATATGTGTVTSVAAAAGSSKVTVTGSPITTSGTITVDVVEANLTHANIGGVVPIAKGGTGQTALGTSKQYLRTNTAASATEWVALAATDVSGLSTVAVSGSYNDLLNKPTIFSGAYADLTGKPVLFSGSYTDLTNKPTFATVATTGSYADLLNRPTLFSGSYTDLTNKPAFATVATSGSYNDLLNKPTIPAAYTLPTASDTVLGGIKVGANLSIDANGVLSATSGGGSGTVTSVALSAGSSKVSVSGGPITSSGTLSVDVVEANLTLANQSGNLSTDRITGLATVATTGSYTDLTNKPAVGEVNTASNKGTGSQVYQGKTGVDLAFRTLVAGSNVTLSQGTDTITINASVSSSGGSSGPAGSTAPGWFRWSQVQNPGNTTTNGTDAASVGITGLPDGWSVTVTGGVTVITHPMGKPPAQVIFYVGAGSTTNPSYKMVPGGNTAAVGSVALPVTGTTALNTTSFQYTLASSMSTIANGTTYVTVMF